VFLNLSTASSDFTKHVRVILGFDDGKSLANETLPQEVDDSRDCKQSQPEATRAYGLCAKLVLKIPSDISGIFYGAKTTT
jgi:hypothetical protein